MTNKINFDNPSIEHLIKDGDYVIKYQNGKYLLDPHMNYDDVVQLSENDLKNIRLYQQQRG